MATTKEPVTSLQKAGSVQDELLEKLPSEQAKELMKSFEEVKDEQLQQLTSEYLELLPNKVYNFIFTGVVKFQGKDREIDAVELVNSEGEKGISGLTVLVNSLKKVTQMPCYVRIVTKKKETSGTGGKYLDMDVYVLPQTVEK